MCSSFGPMRTIGPEAGLNHVVHGFLIHLPTILLVKASKLPRKPAFGFDNIVVAFIPSCQRRQFGAREFGKGMKVESVNNECKEVGEQ
jgi:hypothetical protein